MTKEEFKKLCEENGVELKDLPAFPPNTFLDFANDKEKYDTQWRQLIKMVGELKKEKENKSQS